MIEPSRDRCRAVSRAVSGLTDLDVIQHELTRAVDEGTDVSWDARAYGNGLAGIAHVVLLLQEDGLEVGASAHQLLVDAVEATKAVPLQQHGLFDGAVGLDHALSRFAARDDRYAATSRRFHGRLRAAVRGEVAIAAPSSSDLDLISGRAGWLVHFAASAGEEAEDRSLAGDLARSLSGYVRSVEHPLLGIPAGSGAAPEAGAADHCDTGLAHGSAGLLLALSSALVHGVVDIEVRQGITRLVEAFLATADHGDEVRRWPRALSTTGEAMGAADFPAWCFGNIGIELALLRAGEAVGDDGLRRDAAASILQHIERAFVRAEIKVADASVCHGVAGVILMHEVIRPYVDAIRWRDARQELDARLDALIDPTAAFGFTTADREGRRMSDPALLMGSGGALLVLAGDAVSDRSWSRILTGGMADA